MNGSSCLVRASSDGLDRVQSGPVGTYAWVLVVGVLAVLGAFTFDNQEHGRSSPSIGYDNWVLPALLLIPVIGAVVDLARGPMATVPRATRSAAARSPARMVALIAFAVEFVVSIGLWWSFDPANAGWQAVDRPAWIPIVGHSLHARHRRHRR